MHPRARVHPHGETLNRRDDRRKETHARVPTGWEDDGRRTDSSVLSHVSRGGTDRFTGSSGCCRPRLHTSAHLVHSPARVHAGDSVPRRTLVRVCRLGQVFNGHVITSSCVHHPAEWTTRSYNVERHEDTATGHRFVRFPFDLLSSSSSSSSSASSSFSRHDSWPSPRPAQIGAVARPRIPFKENLRTVVDV